MKLVVIDGQGGGFGKAIIEALRAKGYAGDILAVGTNALATSAMLKAGASAGATGENAAAVNALVPAAKCNVQVAGLAPKPLGELIEDAARKVLCLLEQGV